MYALDFEYDGQYLSDFGFIICDFNASSGANIVNAGSKITFNTVPIGKGKKHGLVGTKYDECIQATFDICKNPEIYNDLEITNDEYRDLVRWLNRNNFYKFQTIDEANSEHETCFYQASFNIDKVKISEKLYGLELTMFTDSPFGYGCLQKKTLKITDTSKEYYVHDLSDEIGYIYPTLKITCNQSGTLSIYNETYDSKMEIKNCSTGEVITINGDIQYPESSLSSHKIFDDFNFEFLKIGNTLNNRENKLTVSLKCTIEITYLPKIKDAPD